MFDEKFFLAISFFTFVFLVKKYAWPLIAKSLDGKSKAIAETILEAKEMKQKAAKFLEQAKKYEEESKQYAQKLIEDTNKEVERITLEAHKAVEDEISKRSKLAMQRIQNEEEKAIRNLKEDIIAQASKNINQELKNIDASNHNKILDRALESL